ncbi:acyl-CoA ligase (AMP-forming), exosortase A system-associated [Alishewanella jeotgali]|uniref:Acyl-CoA ligase n=1 Tax=Alishewanella jeotgali KCTC 22429 TaxID=1129374 RepID=H3ZBA7_9ALTE|nr:acyl-CoA ligase (AMP-forming), exosortase A system-associated [Alishewanella jeotgali]EHR42221.1 acyl-CoA ligase [Alishewanella jeotgali KCTC 22429]
MTNSLAELLSFSARRFAERPALHYKNQHISYAQLQLWVQQQTERLSLLGLQRFDRVAIYLPKQLETVVALFACNSGGAVFVPVNPALKAAQVQHILNDCNVRCLITSVERLHGLTEVLTACPDLHTVLVVDSASLTAVEQLQPLHSHYRVMAWLEQREELSTPNLTPRHQSMTDADMAAILYTSGSTGKPKGVVLSQRNLLCGAASVASYLQNTPDDVLLGILPLSFDYGLSQLTTAFSVGASVVLLDFLLVQDVVRAVEHYQVTGIAAVPPLWAQLAKANWPEGSASSVRYFTNSGGAMPQALLSQLQIIFNKAEPYLMYGLTEAFRSTYLPPSELLRRPGSMGRAIPNAEILVVREDGSLCGPNEPGELVHRGPLVSLGYWNAPEKTAERFKPDPLAASGIQLAPLAVFSGDTVKYDEEGFLYFIGRRDEMIKTSGYRVSPTEVEEAVYRLDPAIQDVAALGIYDGTDQGILVLVALAGGASKNTDVITGQWLIQLKRSLPNFMIPRAIVLKDGLPKNPNGKIDRKALAQEYQHYFSEAKPNE